jgi:hypothetical protein
MNTDDLPFGDDFTWRVLDTADTIARRRRQTRRVVLSGAVLLLAGAGTLSALRGVRPSMPVADNAPHLVTSFDTVASDDTQTEPTEYLFPEAADLTQFSRNYAGIDADEDTSTTGDADDQVIFTDAEENTGG